MAGPDPATTEWVPIWNPTSEGPIGPEGPAGPPGTDAPLDAPYITSAAHALFTAERVLTDTATVTWDFATAGQARANATVPPGYDNEMAQDAVGGILVDTATIDLVYNDTTPSITAAVIAGSIGTTQLTDDGVTFAKFQNITSARLLGRTTAAAGNVEELTVGAGLSLSAGVLSSTITQYTDELAQDAIGPICVDTTTINFTYNDATPSIIADIVAGSVGTTQLTDAGVTYAKMQDVTDNRLLGRSAGSAGDVQEIQMGTGLSLTAGVLTATAPPVEDTPRFFLGGF